MRAIKKFFVRNPKLQTYSLIILIVLSLVLVLAASLASYKKSTGNSDTDNKMQVQANTVMKSTGVEYTIEIRADGFYPKDITVPKNSKVRFVTRLDKSFWPASNLHPSHEIYPEFDSKKPISAKSYWEFVFGRSGSWSYHDHLSPLYEGTITVLDSASVSPNAYVSKAKTVEECKRKYDQKCWSALIQYTFETKGFDAAYDLFEEIYNTVPLFAQNCHEYTHQIGKRAYVMFSKKEDFPLSDRVAYCSYGFFHGFIEAMMADTGSFSGAKEMCDYIGKKLSGRLTTDFACWHGIGHGITDASDKNAYGDEWKLITPSLKFCEGIASNNRELDQCAGGVYSALSVMYTQPKYGIFLDEKDPFRICKEQKKDSYKAQCLSNFKRLIMKIVGNDFLKAAKFVEDIKEDELAQAAIDNLATFYVYFLLKDPTYDRGIKDCYALQGRLHTSCITGMAAGFMTVGKPDFEYARPLELCTNNLVTKEDQEACHDRIVRLIQMRYSEEKFSEICQDIVQSSFKKYCDKWRRMGARNI
jgi:hypothetical protein